MSSILKYLLERLREPSSWGGLSVLLMLGGINVSAEQVSAIIQLLAAAAGTAGVFMKDKPAKIVDKSVQAGQ